MMERAIRVLALTPQGAALAREICRGLAGARCWLPRSQGGEDPEVGAFDNVAAVFQEAFEQSENLVCVMAAGIVVRGIAPYLRGKDKDPAVVVVDEAGQFAVSLLSGHLGGANDLAREVARILDGTPVITTATDVQKLPALDSLAAERGLLIENLAPVRQVSMALLSGRPVRLVDPEGYLADIVRENPGLFIIESKVNAAPAGAGPGVYVGFREGDWPPEWLILRPRNLVAGMGCHKGTPVGELIEFIQKIFRQERLSLASLKALATIEAKKEEPGLRQAAQELGVEFLWFTAEELKTVNVPHPSPQVAKHLGVMSVSEAAALKAGGGELILAKVKGANATLAVARAA
ncbi:MAG: cobalt-precorrin 5A hydrolase [Syntrophales bacterium]|nr:cobalt-precorrin 5A hydrolase [Syntrophales bacterium]MDD5642489.1 cobalt-precorrin 5A hydrolase [Syntrophales bacterium]